MTNWKAKASKLWRDKVSNWKSAWQKQKLLI